MSDKRLTGDPRIDFSWFSRRHESSAQHREAQDVWRVRHDPAIVAERLADRAALTAEQQIQRLDQRLGVGQGAVRERAKLMAAIAKAAKITVTATKAAK